MKTTVAALGFALFLTWGPAAPLAAEDGPYYPDEDLCQAMFRFAESATTQSRRVRLRKGRGAIATLKCANDSSQAGREICASLEARAEHLAVPVLAQDALACIGVREPGSDDPDAIVLRSFWTHGTFKSVLPHLADGKVRLEISLDGREKTSRPWIAVAAIPVR